MRANLDYLAGSGVEVDAGVLVDGRLRSSAEDVYAAGDAAQAANQAFTAAQQQWLSLWEACGVAAGQPERAPRLGR